MLTQTRVLRFATPAVDRFGEPARAIEAELERGTVAAAAVEQAVEPEVDVDAIGVERRVVERAD
jgi:hypothetical protein